jgi:hypothetical protein
MAKHSIGDDIESLEAKRVRLQNRRTKKDSRPTIRCPWFFKVCW